MNTAIAPKLSGKTVIDLLDIVVERRKKLFPDIRKIIVDYTVHFGDGTLTLDVTSAPIPDLGAGKEL